MCFTHCLFPANKLGAAQHGQQSRFALDRMEPKNKPIPRDTNQFAGLIGIGRLLARLPHPLPHLADFRGLTAHHIHKLPLPIPKSQG